MAKIDSCVLTGAQTKCRDVHTRHDSFESNFLTHEIHHQLAVQRETWQKIPSEADFIHPRSLMYNVGRYLYITGIRHCRVARCPVFDRTFRFLPRHAMHKRGLCRHAMSVCLCVCPSRSWIVSKRINISSKFFHHRVATPF